MTHLVGQVVGDVVVPIGLRNSGAALCLAIATDDAESSDTSTVLADTDVPDVVVRGPDELADDKAVSRQRGAVTGGELCLREAGVDAARPVRPVGLRRRAEVEEIFLR